MLQIKKPLERGLTVDGGVGVHGPDDDLKLGEDAVSLLGILADEAEAANAIAVETELQVYATISDVHACC
jgi:hypothetical protein